MEYGRGDGRHGKQTTEEGETSGRETERASPIVGGVPMRLLYGRKIRSRAQEDEILLDSVLSTLRNGHNGILKF